MCLHRYSFLNRGGFLYPHVIVELQHKNICGTYAGLVDTGATESLIDGDIAYLFDHDLRHKDVERGDMNTAANPIRKYYHSFRIKFLAEDRKTIIFDSGNEIKLCCSRRSRWLVSYCNFVRNREIEKNSIILGWDVLKFLQLHFYPHTQEQYFEIGLNKHSELLKNIDTIAMNKEIL